MNGAKLGKGLVILDRDGVINRDSDKFIRNSEEWQPLPGSIWVVEAPAARIILWSLYASGWAYLFAATFVTNHFELMGLRQVYLYFRNKPYTALPFVRKYMYRYSRHPMMLGLLLAFWSTPDMSATRFVLATLLTIYIFVGIRFEERSLIQEFGERYRQYQKEIGLFFTFGK